MIVIKQDTKQEYETQLINKLQLIRETLDNLNNIDRFNCIRGIKLEGMHEIVNSLLINEVKIKKELRELRESK